VSAGEDNFNFRRVAEVIVSALVVAYAWFATGVTPFHALSYVVVAIPVLVVAGLYVALRAFANGRSGVTHFYMTRSLGVSLGRLTPWLIVLVGAVTLEAVGLALGGRSARVPTLSTTVDHLLSTHGLRCVFFLAWILVGALPLRRLAEFRGTRTPR
jgi:hypothetical protein